MLNLSAGDTILDIGCGPGSNAPIFKNCKYTGIDINPAYISHARKKYPGVDFLTKDARELAGDGRLFSYVIVNSFLHHIDDASAFTLFETISHITSNKSKIVLSEPLVPEKGLFLRLMMQLDRGKYFRNKKNYYGLADKWFAPEKEKEYYLKYFGKTGWLMLCALLNKN